MELISVTRDAPWGRWCQYFLAGKKNDAQTIQLVHHLQEVPGAPCDTIKGGDEHNREPLLSCICHQRIQSRTPCLASRNPTS